MTADTNDADALGSVDADREPTDQAAAADERRRDRGDDEAEQMLADLDALQRERDDLLDTTQRLQADFENYRKRVLREQTVLVERATEGSSSSCCRCSTASSSRSRNLDAATSTTTACARASSSCTRSCSACSSAPVSSASTRTGAPFDPNEHEAVMQDDGDGEPHVGDVLRTGWKLKGRVLRPAMVKVVR